MALKSRAGFTIETVISGASTTEFYKPINNTTTLFAVNSDVTAKLGLKADQTAVDALVLASATKAELAVVEAKIPVGAVLTNVKREINGDLTLSFTDSATYPNKTVLAKTTSGATPNTQTEVTAGTKVANKYVQPDTLKVELDKKQNISELITVIRDSATSTDIKYPSEKAVRTLFDSLSIVGVYKGSSNTLATLPVGVNRDWAILNTLDGTNKAGIYVTDGTTYTLAMEIQGFLTLTDAQAVDKTSTVTGVSNPKQWDLQLQSNKGGLAEIPDGTNTVAKGWDALTLNKGINDLINSARFWNNNYAGYGDGSVTVNRLQDRIIIDPTDLKFYKAIVDVVPVNKQPKDNSTEWSEVYPVGDGLRGVPVTSKTALKALTAREYERRIILPSKYEYVFYKTANLTAEEIANVNPPNENIIDDANTGMWVLQTPKGVSVDFDYQLGHIIHAVPDSSKAIYEINGSTITDGKLAQYLNANQIDGFVINGNNITLPDWRGRYLGGAGGLGLAPAIGTTYESSNKTHRHIVGVNNASSGNSYGQSSINYSNTSNSPNSSVYTSNTGGVYARPETVAMPICIIGGRSIEIPKLLPTDVVVDKSGLVDGDVLVYDLAGDKFKKGVIPQPVIQPKEYFSFNFTGNGAGNIPSKTFTPTRTGEYRFTINSTGWLNSGTGMQGFLCNVSGTDNDNKSIEGRRFFHSSGKHDAIIWQKKKVKLIAGQQVTLSFTKTTSQIKVDSNDWITIDVVQL